MLRTRLIVLATLVAGVARAQTTQRVEGFDKVEFHHNANGAAPTRDFRGTRPRLHDGRLVGARADEEELRLLEDRAGAGESSRPRSPSSAPPRVLPSEFSRGPSAKLTSMATKPSPSRSA